MKPDISIITLAVKDLDAAYSFYTEGLGITGETARNDTHIAIGIDEKISLALYATDAFNKIAGQSGEHDKFARVCVSHTAKSSAEVDDILLKAKAAGGVLTAPAKEYDWGYSGYFKDLDGHLWEIVWFGE